MRSFIAVLSLSVFSSLAASQTPLPNRGGPGLMPGMPTASRPKWEYTILSREDIQKRGAGDFVAGLNKLGEEGWELISIMGPRGAPRAEETLFKRLKESARGAPGGLNFSGGRGDSRPGAAPNWQGQPGKGQPGRASSQEGQPGKGRAPAASAELSNVIGKALRNSKGTEKEVTKVIRLKHAGVASLQRIVQELYGQKVRLASDERTNSLIVVGAEEPLTEILALIQQLDGPEEKRDGKGNK